MLYKVSSQGEAVKQIQQKLGIEADGYYGPVTEKAVIAFQQSHKLSADGIVGPLTWQALFKTVLPIPNPSPPPKPGTNPYGIKNYLLTLNGEFVNRQFSPNKGGVIVPELVVIHYTGDNSLQGALSWLCAPQARVSAHLVIAKTGVVWQLVPFNVRAWHAGSSSWDGRGDCNSWSIGIENVGFGDEWPEAQIEANQLVVQALAKAYGITEVVGHEDIAPGRKVDPGPNFPWDQVWPNHEEA